MPRAWQAGGGPRATRPLFSTRQRERIISTRTTTTPRTDGGAEDRSGAALAAETPFGSDLPYPYAGLGGHSGDSDTQRDQEAESTSVLPAWTLPQVATVLAGAGAAATSTLIGGRLGVAGTVVGAAVASIVTTLALNLYDNALKRVTHQLKTKVVVGRGPGEGSPDPTADTAGQDASGSSPAQPWRRRPMTRKVIRWTLVTALASTLLGLGLMVGIERGTATPITPGTSQLAGTAERSDSGTDQGSGTRDSGTTGADTNDGSEVETDTEVVAPSVAPTGAETIVPTEVPTPGASDATGSDTTTSDGSTTTDSGTTSGGATTDGSTSGGTTSGTTGDGSGTTSGGTSGTTDGSTGTTP